MDFDNFQTQRLIHNHLQLKKIKFWQFSNTKINAEAATSEKHAYWQFSNTKINTQAVTP